MKQRYGRRGGLDFRGAQTGDVQARDTVGRDTHTTTGMSGAEVGNLFNQMQEWRAKDRAYEADRLDWQIKQRERDELERDGQRILLNSRLDAIQRQVSANSRRIRLILVLVSLAIVAIIVGAVVLTWLILDRAAGMVVARMLTGSVAALSVAALRGR